MVLAWNNLTLTKRCVESLRANTRSRYELIIVDNGSDQEAARYAAQSADIPVLNETNLGFAAGMNSGLYRASGEIVAFINNDTQFPPGWDTPLLHHFDDTMVGLVAPAVTAAGNPVTVRSEPAEEVIRLLPFAELPSGVVYLARTRVIRELGGWNESYDIASSEDLDLCFTIWANGLDFVLDTRVLVGHVGQATVSKLPEKQRLYRQNLEQFLSRWEDEDNQVARLSSIPSWRHQANIARARTAARWMRRLFDCRQELRDIMSETSNPSELDSRQVRGVRGWFRRLLSQYRLTNWRKRSLPQFRSSILRQVSRRQLALVAAGIAGALGLVGIVVAGVLFSGGTSTPQRLFTTASALVIVGAALAGAVVLRRLSHIDRVVQRQGAVQKQTQQDVRTLTDTVGVISENAEADSQLLRRIQVHLRKHDESSKHQLKSERGELAEIITAATQAQGSLHRLVRSENSALYKQVEGFLRLRDLLDLKLVPGPLGGWALGADLAAHLVDLCRRTKPINVVEAGSGISTALMAAVMRMNGSGHVLSLEHLPEYAESTEALLGDYDLRAWATVAVAPLEPIEIAGETYHWYDRSTLSLPSRIDLLLVDGPPGVTGPRARFPAVPLLLDRLGSGTTILLDDAHRPGEQACIEGWRSLLPEHEFRLLDHLVGSAEFIIA